MKGLLLKDFYGIIKYGRPYFIIVAVFAFISVFMHEEKNYFVLYPCVLAALVPVTLLSYDERSKWNIYCQGMPVKKSEIVSSKYILGLCFMILVILVLCITNSVRMHINGTFTPKKLGNLISVMLIMFLAGSFPIPFIFKYGVEKGRLVYYIITFAIYAGLSVLFGIMGTNGETNVGLLGNINGFVLLGVAVIYLLTWKLSIFIFERKEDV